jgi:hypothetical protein
MMDATAVRAWASVHATRPAAVVLATVLVLSPLFATTSLTRMGFLHLLKPLPVILLLTLLAGTAAAMASVVTFDPWLPDPPIARAASLLWALLWLGLGLAAASAGHLVSADASVAGIGRNVIIYAALGHTMVRIAGGRFVWLPATAITLTAVLFGYPEAGPQRYYWWAIMLDDAATSLQLGVASLMYAATLALVARSRAWRRVQSLRRDPTRPEAAPAGK